MENTRKQTIFFVSILIFVCGIGAMFLYSETGKKRDVDTSNWKTYRNDEYGFEIRYPDGWMVTRENDSVFFQSTNLNSEKEKILPLLEVTVAKGESIKEWVRNFERGQSAYTKILSQESYGIRDVVGTKIVYSTDIGLNHETILVQINKENMVIFSFPMVDDVSSYFERAIQTFRLIY